MTNALPPDRRTLLAMAMLSFPVYALAAEARAAGVIGDRRMTTKRWIDRQEELAHGLRSGSISLAAWREGVASVAREADVAQLWADVARASAKPGEAFMRDPVKRRVRFPGEDGRPRHLTYGVASFTFGPDSVITPHAHKHMASAHMVIDGRVRIRTFDRLADKGPSLLIRPTGDHIGEAGTAAAMTTERDNIHWFTPVTPHAVTLDVIIDGLDPRQDSYLIQPVDPLGGKVMRDGTILAPLMSFEASMKAYTAQM